MRALLVDLDDTLFDHDCATRMALAYVQSEEPAFTCWPLDELHRRHMELLERLHERVMAGHLSVEDARVERFGRLFTQATGKAPAAHLPQLARGYREAYEASWRPVAGAPELLAAVRCVGLSIVVVTNNQVAEQQQKLDVIGLAPCIDVLVTSEDIGVLKPAPEIFQSALARAGVAAAEAVMLGDSWAADIEGARQVGIRAVWLNRFGRVSPDAAVAELSSLAPAGDAFRVIVYGAECDRV